MTKSGFLELALATAREAGVEAGIHGYFRLHQERIWTTLEHFHLAELRGLRVLEIGPFYSYSPFVLRHGGNEVWVLEGEEEVVEPLKAVYARQGMHAFFGDLFTWFGPGGAAPARLPYEDGQFDAVVCCETMEHFNFNPVPFVKDLLRILKPGGRAFITVPNIAKLDKRLDLLSGRSVYPPVAAYYQYAGQQFYGFHWREYTLPELQELFRSAGFQVQAARYLQTFETRPDAGLLRQAKRAIARALSVVVPSFASLCTVIVQKPEKA